MDIEKTLFGDRPKSGAAAAHTLSPKQSLLSCDGFDITRNLQRKKSKLLIVLPGSVTPFSAGCFGSLCDLHTESPYILIDLPGNRRLKCEGKVVSLSRPVIGLKLQKSLTVKEKKTISTGSRSGSILLENVWDSALVLTKCKYVVGNS